MTVCSKMFEGLERRLKEKKTLDQIGKELCSDVKDPRGKVIRIIKEYKDEEYLIENSDWLGYNIPKNPTGGKAHSQENLIQKNLDKEPYEVEAEEPGTCKDGVCSVPPRPETPEAEDAGSEEESEYEEERVEKTEHPIGTIDIDAKTGTIPFCAWYIGYRYCQGCLVKEDINRMNSALKNVGSDAYINYIDYYNSDVRPFNVWITPTFAGCSETGFFMGDAHHALPLWLKSCLGAEKYEAYCKEEERLEEEREAEKVKENYELSLRIHALSLHSVDENRIQEEIEKESGRRVELKGIKDLLIGKQHVRLKYENVGKA